MASPTWLDALLFGKPNVMINGTPQTWEPFLNLLGATATDNPANGSIDVTVGGGQIPNVIDVTKPPYNAKGDGSTDDTAAIQAAWDAAGEGGKIFFPGPLQGHSNRQYKILGSLVAPAVHQTGIIAIPQARLEYQGESAAIDANTHRPGIVTINGITVENTGSIQAGSKGFYGSAGSVFYLTNCTFLGMDSAIKATDYVYCRIESCFFGSNSKGIQLLGSGGLADVYCPTSEIVGCHFDVPASKTGISLGDTSALVVSQVIGCQFNIDPGGVGVDGVFTIGSVIDACSWEIDNGGTVGIQFQAGSYGNDWSGSGLNDINAGSGVIVDSDGGNYPPVMGAALSSGTTITPTGRIHHVTGTTTVQTISVPTNVLVSTQPIDLVLVFDSACPIGTSGNISRTSTTAAGQRVALVYDPATSKWYY